MKRKVLFLFLSFMIIFQAGCSSVSVEDAKKINDREKAKSVRNLNKYREELAIENDDKEYNKEEKNNNLQDPDFSVDISDNKKINILDMQEIAKRSGFEIMVLNSVNEKNIDGVNKVSNEKESSMVREMLLNDFGPGSRIAKVKGSPYILEDGSITGAFESMIFIKIKIKNTMSRSREICITPNFYEKNDSGVFNYVPYIECIAMSNPQHNDNDWTFFTIEAGKEEEFVIAFSSRKNIENKDLYISLGFLGSQNESSNPTKISDGESLIKVVRGE